MKLIIFDIDGTLTDTKKVDDLCFIKAFETTFGIDIQNQVWADLKNITDWGITEEIINYHWNRNPTAEEYRQMHNHHIANLGKAKKEHPDLFASVKGANRFIQTLQANTSYAIGIATGAWQKSALIKLEGIVLTPLELPFSNSDYHKTREKITLHTIDQATQNQSFEKIIYFGDGLWDYKTCKNLNIPFIGIDIHGDNQLKQAGATTIFPNYLDQAAIIRAINSI